MIIHYLQIPLAEPFLGYKLAIKDDQGNELPQGKIGTLWVKGDNIMLATGMLQKQQLLF